MIRSSIGVESDVILSVIEEDGVVDELLVLRVGFEGDNAAQRLG